TFIEPHPRPRATPHRRPLPARPAAPAGPEAAPPPPPPAGAAAGGRPAVTRRGARRGRAGAFGRGWCLLRHRTLLERDLVGVELLAFGTRLLRSLAPHAGVAIAP